MRKLLILLLVFPLLAQGQYLGISSTSFFTDFSKPNAYFRSLTTVSGNSSAALRNPITGVGAELTTTLNAAHGQSYLSDVSLEYFVPTGFHDTNDSLYFVTKGVEFTSCLLGFQLLNKEPWHLVCGPGMNFGYLRIKRNLKDGSADGYYKNPFFSPLVRLEIKYFPGKSVFSFRAFYRYDLGKPGWERSDQTLPVLPQLAWSGFGFQLGLGFYIQ